VTGVQSANLLGHHRRTVRIARRIHLRHVGLGIPEQYLGRLWVGLPPDAGSVGVPELMRMPAVCPSRKIAPFPHVLREKE